MLERTLLLAAALLLGAHAASAAPDLASLEPATEATPLLEGRLTVRLPVGARVEPRAASGLSAPEPARETRLELEAGDQRLVLTAAERFVLAGDRFQTAVMAEAGMGVTIHPMRLSGLKGFRAEPAKLEGRNDILVARADVADRAGLVLTVVLTANQAAVTADEPGLRALARKVLDTLAPGPRTIDLKAREVQLERLEGAGALTVKVPAGWASTAHVGRDHRLYRVQQVVTMGQAVTGVGIYVGKRPWLLQDGAPKSAKVEPVAGKLLGADVEWKRWTAQDRTTLEAVTPLPVQDLVAHVFVMASGDDALAAGRALAERSLKLQRR